jgi:hypothetical protein
MPGSTAWYQFTTFCPQSQARKLWWVTYQLLDFVVNLLYIIISKTNEVKMQSNEHLETGQIFLKDAQAGRTYKFPHNGRTLKVESISEGSVRVVENGETHNISRNCVVNEMGLFTFVEPVTEKELAVIGEIPVEPAEVDTEPVIAEPVVEQVVTKPENLIEVPEVNASVPKNIAPIIGQTFNHLTILSYNATESSIPRGANSKLKPYVNYHCNACGSEGAMNKNWIVGGQKIDCGCKMGK